MSRSGWSCIYKIALSGADAQKVIERAVHNYFAYKTALNQREFKLLLREGRLSLAIGLLFLTLCLSGGQLANRLQIPGASIVETSLTIAGWVAMWHPMDVFLYGWWPLRRAGKVYRKLSAIPVEVRYSESASSAGQVCCTARGLNLRFAILAPKIAIASRPSIGSGWGPRVSERLSEDVSSPSAHSSKFR